MNVIQPTSNRWQFITSDEVRDASLDYNVAKAEQTVQAVNAYVTLLFNFIINASLFGYFAVPNMAANCAISATIATPIVQAPVHYVSDKLSSNTVRTVVYNGAANEGINPKYCPSTFAMACAGKQLAYQEAKASLGGKEPSLFQRATLLVGCA